MEAFYRFFKRFERITGESFYALGPPSRAQWAISSRGDDPLLDGRGRRTPQPISWRRWTTISTRAAASASLFDLLRPSTNSSTTKSSKTQPGAMPAKVHTPLRAARWCSSEIASPLGLFRKPRRRKGRRRRRTDAAS